MLCCGYHKYLQWRWECRCLSGILISFPLLCTEWWDCCSPFAEPSRIFHNRSAVMFPAPVCNGFFPSRFLPARVSFCLFDDSHSCWREVVHLVLLICISFWLVMLSIFPCFHQLCERFLWRNVNGLSAGLKFWDNTALWSNQMLSALFIPSLCCEDTSGQTEWEWLFNQFLQ